MDEWSKTVRCILSTVLRSETTCMKSMGCRRNGSIKGYRMARIVSHIYFVGRCAGWGIGVPLELWG